MRGLGSVSSLIIAGGIAACATQTAPINHEAERSQLEAANVAFTGAISAFLNCTFAPGLIHAIVGPSGSGKSTLVNTILGLHPPISGEIQVGRSSDDQATLREEVPVKAWLANIGYLSQQPFLFNTSMKIPVDLSAKA